MVRSRLAAAGVAAVGLAVLVPQGPAEAAGTVTATYEPANHVLRVTGDGEANVVAVGKSAAGQLVVNGGAVPIAGGTATVANTATIVVTTGAGDDVVRIDEANGAMPKSTMFLGSGDDHGTGGSGGDLLSGDQGVDVLEGRLGVDNVFGGSERDFLRGDDGADVVVGGTGDDQMTWTSGDDADTLSGGPGVDLATVEGSTSSEIYTLAPDSTTGLLEVTDFSGNVVVDSETLDVSGNGGSDTVITTPGTAEPGMPHLRLLGGAGNDGLFGAEGDEELFGGDGVDVLNGGGGADVLRGFLGDDLLDGGPGADQVDGEQGNDRTEWRQGGGDDVVQGGEGDDVLAVATGSAPDTVGVVAGPGGRVQVRSAGVFTVDAASERVEVFGGAANDVLSVGAGIGLLTKVRLDGGPGDDRLDGDDAGNALVGAEGNDLLFGERGDDVLDGGPGNDQLVGNEGDDLESGGDGDDTLFGNQGNDNLDGGPGFDFLRGGTGFDVGFNGEDVLSVP